MKKLRWTAALLTAVAATAVGITTASPAIADTDGPVLNAGNGLCLTPEEQLQGAAVLQATCVVDQFGNYTDRSQQWDFVCFTSNCSLIHVRNHQSLLCLDVGNGAVNGSRIQLWTCNNNSDLRWDFGPNPGSMSPNFVLRSRVSNKTSHCLDVPSASAEDRLPLQLFTCNTTSAQIWKRGPGIIE